MSIGNFKDIRDAYEHGRVTWASYRKTPTQITTAGIWFDLSMSGGIPSAQTAWASTPLIAKAMARSTDMGLDHKGNVSPYNKHLRILCNFTGNATAAPLNMKLLDYLLIYPFVDESLDGEEQLMDNTVTLPRSITGEGVMMMPVVTSGHATGGATFTVNYTNSAGVAGRTSVPARLNTQFVNGTILTSDRATDRCTGPFITLQAGDTGVRSVQGVTMTGSDVGLFSLCLVKPIADCTIKELTAPTEIDYYIDQNGLLPKIEDDAYLNFICCPNGSLTGTQIIGYIETIWG